MLSTYEQSVKDLPGARISFAEHLRSTFKALPTVSDEAYAQARDEERAALIANVIANHLHGHFPA